MARDSIVIGGGIIGVATAWRLAQAGARVTLLEAGIPGHGASLVGFGWLNANDKPPLPYHRLNTPGMAEHRRLRRELGHASWLHQTGNVEWLRGPDGASHLRQKVDRLQRWGYSAELLPVRELRRLEPDLVPPPDLAEFAFYADEGYVDLLALIGELLAAARAAGAEIRPGTRATGLARAGDRVVGVETDQGERLAADMVVSAAGARSAEVARWAGCHLPMAPTVGMVAVTAPSATRLRGVHHDGEMNIRPDGAGRVMIGHHAAFDAQAHPGQPVPPAVLAALRDHVAGVLPGLAGVPIEAARVTHRPIPGDGYPAVGPLPGAPGCYLVATHSGATLGPLLARLVAAEIAHTTPDPRLAPFRPDRLIAPLPVANPS